MELGGVMLGAGMVLNIAKDDHRSGGGRIDFMLLTVGEIQGGWVVLDGEQRPTATSTWRTRRIEVRVSALRRSLILP